MVELTIGDNAPSFSLKDQDGKTVSLADFEGRRLLLYFYPKADTPGCTEQACRVRDGVTEVGKQVKEARRYVEEHFRGNPGMTEGWFYPTTHEDAQAWLPTAAG